MRRIFGLILFCVVFCSTISCSSSRNTTILKGVSLSYYKYLVFGKENDGDAELADILMMVQNELANKFIVVSSVDAVVLSEKGEKVLAPSISVKSEKWDGGHTYIAISFYDFDTNQCIAVVKSSGIGVTVSHDQRLAFSAIKKELDKVFK